MGSSSKSTKFKLVAMLLIGVAIGAALGYGVAFMVMSTEKSSEIKVGFIYGLTGNDAPFGDKARRAFEWFIEEVNKAGGIKSLGGMNITAVWGDSQGKPEVGMAEAERLITEGHVVTIFGTRQSSIALPVAGVCERYKIPFVIADSSAVALTNGTYKWVARPVITDAVFAKGQFQFLKDLQDKTGIEVKTIAYVYEDSSWGALYAQEWRINNADPVLGGYTVVADIPYKRGSPDLSSEVLTLKTANPQVVFMAAYQADALLYAKLFKEQLYRPELLLGQSGFHANEYISAVKNTDLNDYYCDTIYYNADINKSKSIEVKNRWEARYPDIPAFPELMSWYTAFYTYVKALEKAGSLQAEQIRTAILSIETPEAEVPILGGVKFNENGQNIAIRCLTMQWLNNSWRTVYPFEYAAADVKFPIPKWPGQS
jgi:branched-chain amino acid transport system substrate-binding protein